MKRKLNGNVEWSVLDFYEKKIQLKSYRYNSYSYLFCVGGSTTAITAITLSTNMAASKLNQ